MKLYDMGNNEMTAYDFRYKKQFAGLNFFGKAAVSAERKVAQLVNSNWVYSMHWPKEINQEWVNAVNADINREMEIARNRLSDLELAKKLVDGLEL